MCVCDLFYTLQINAKQCIRVYLSRPASYLFLNYISSSSKSIESRPFRLTKDVAIRIFRCDINIVVRPRLRIIVIILFDPAKWNRDLSCTVLVNQILTANSLKLTQRILLVKVISEFLVILPHYLSTIRTDSSLYRLHPPSPPVDTYIFSAIA